MKVRYQKYIAEQMLRYCIETDSEPQSFYVSMTDVVFLYVRVRCYNLHRFIQVHFD